MREGGPTSTHVRGAATAREEKQQLHWTVRNPCTTLMECYQSSAAAAFLSADGSDFDICGTWVDHLASSHIRGSWWAGVKWQRICTNAPPHLLGGHGGAQRACQVAHGLVLQVGEAHRGALSNMAMPTSWAGMAGRSARVRWPMVWCFR